MADVLGPSAGASSEVAAVGSTVGSELGAAAVSAPIVAGPGVAAEVGRAMSLGQLSVPQSWVAAPTNALAG